MYWSGWPDLNRRPLHPQCSALPDCATSRIYDIILLIYNTIYEIFIYITAITILIHYYLLGNDLNTNNVWNSNGYIKNGVVNWDDIPYAKPPIGDLRWKAPRELDSLILIQLIQKKIIFVFKSHLDLVVQMVIVFYWLRRLFIFRYKET